MSPYLTKFIITVILDLLETVAVFRTVLFSGRNMAKIKGKYWFFITLVLFAAYFLVAARPVTDETILMPRWISTFEAEAPVHLGDFQAIGANAASREPLPFRAGSRYGFFSEHGSFLINEIAQGYISISENFWAQYIADPPYIHIMDAHGEVVLTIEDPQGYPVFLDNRIFIVGVEQNSITAIALDGRRLWQHDFRAPLTGIDAAAGRVLAGTLDGAIELLDQDGRPVIAPFEPGGSRLQAIFGTAISSCATRLAVISGIDQQRFLLLEQAGDIFMVVHHEFLGSGFRRPVHISFADNDRRVVFEREGGIGIFDVAARTTVHLPLRGEIKVLDTCGEAPYLFVVTAMGENEKRLVTIRYPGVVIGDASFQSEFAFFARRGTRLFLGGDSTVAAFEIGRR